MKVLLTGHRGYIGAVLTPMLLDRGHAVTGLDSDIFRTCTFVGELAETPEIEKDIRDIVIDDVAGFDAIIHLAGLSNDPLGDYRPNLTEEINFEASLRLAQLAKQAGVPRFLYASSCSNYGASGASFLDESAAFNPVTPYGVSKVNVERAVAPMADETFSPTFLRASTAYGLSPRVRFDLVVNNLTAWAFTTGQVFLKSDGSPWRPIVHVADIARAYIAALEADRDLVHNEAFNVGLTTENYQIREIADIVKAIVPNSRIEFALDAGPDTRCYRVDCNYIARRLHAFKPQWTARRGVEQLYDAYCATGLTLEDFEGERFKRIDHVKKLIRDGELDENLRRVTVPAEARPRSKAGNGRGLSKAGGAPNSVTEQTCRCCGGSRLETFLDLGETPLADRLLTDADLGKPELVFPLRVAFCADCSLVQITETVSPEILFGHAYPYYSSFSPALLDHSRENALDLIARRGLGPNSLVVELASNDGYLLKNYVEAGIRVLGIDPADGPAAAAEKIGVPTRCAFFTRDLAEVLLEEGVRADVIHANNVLAHVADTNGFVAAIARLLKDNGVAVIEVPYVEPLIERCEFDTIYHEHLCYFSVTALDKLFRRHGLYLNEIKQLSIHGGSLRLYVEPQECVGVSVKEQLAHETARGINSIGYFRDFSAKVEALKRDLSTLLSRLTSEGASIAAYGAAAKGATLINTAGIGRNDINFVVDRNIHKQGKYMPGQNLPIYPPEMLLETQPNYVLMLAWNFADEILKQQNEYRVRGGKFIVPVPTPRIV